ncbi:MAG TPA: bifunctional ornithine acetyltransferase/N-acetylglutamate synthase [Thermoleophilia bacterium]|nr:bifunctional ornithine acetyltransferase/N-acetylglutamate synthase [Thermoleophilia bacterium]
MLPATRFAALPAWALEAGGGVTHPRGFVAAGVASGVKKRGKLDLGIVTSEGASVSAATFTSNAAAAAPVRLTRETSDCGHLRAMVVNAGNANACTGKQALPTRRACGCGPPTSCACRWNWSASRPPASSACTCRWRRSSRGSPPPRTL